jgi:hypothetical protein
VVAVVVVAVAPIPFPQIPLATVVFTVAAVLVAEPILVLMQLVEQAHRV